MFSFDFFPRLETRRLMLREMTSSDAPALFDIFSDKEVVEFYDLAALTHLDQALEIIERQAERFKGKQGIRWGIVAKENDALIGTCGMYLEPSHRGGIGYDLAKRYWRQGIMTEALSALLRFGFEELGLNRIEAHVMIGNVASERPLSKLGFQEEGILRQYAFFKDVFHDLKSFSLLKGEWRLCEYGSL